MKAEKIIQQLGYKYKEAKVYLAALRLGESKIADIVEKVKMPRTSVLVITKKLHKEGLLNSYSRRFSRYWVAENPEILLERIHEKEVVLKNALPSLKNIQHNNGDGKPEIRVYTGANELRLILDDIISRKQNFCGIIAWEDWINLFGHESIADFISLQKSHFLKFRLLTPCGERSRRLKMNDAKENRETRFLPNRMVPLNTATLIYGNRVAIISINKTLPTGFLVGDVSVSTTMINIFEELWNLKDCSVC